MHNFSMKLQFLGIEHTHSNDVDVKVEEFHSDFIITQNKNTKSCSYELVINYEDH